MRHTENPYSALWRSAASEVVSRHLGPSGKGAGMDADHPLLSATETYLTALEAGAGVESAAPDGLRSDEDPRVAAYLSQLHHRLAHAQSTGDFSLAAELTRERDRFRFGNPLWEQMAIQYLRYYGQYPLHAAGQPQYRSWRDAGRGHDDLGYGVVEWRLPAAARIAVIGDIGTGTDVAAAVLLAAVSMRPDAILHLGDVYYSGTEFEFAHRFTALFDAVWRMRDVKVPVFTVPGNHEYFTGGHAFLACLDSGRLACLPAQRQQASYFCLRTADDGWQFLGMDTGYHGHTLTMPPGKLDDAVRVLRAKDPLIPADATAASLLAPADTGMVRLRDDEAAWHQHQMREFDGRTVLLSHHPLYSATAACGVTQQTVAGPDSVPGPNPADLNRSWVDTALWHQLGPFFGDRVAAWLWGHEHNLNIFVDGYRPPGWPAEADSALRTLPKGRCLGHAAIPVQDTENPYATTYPVPLAGDGLRLGLTDGWYNRGFGFLELSGAGRPVTAQYFQLTGADPTPALIHTETIE